MNLLPFFMSQYAVGIEIHPAEVRLLQLKKSRRFVSIEQIGILGLPKDSIVEGEIVNPSSIQATIEQLVHETKTQGCLAGVALPSDKVMTTSFHLTGNPTEQACEAEVAAHLSQVYLTSEALCFDFVRTYPAEKMVDILCVAVKRQLLNDYISIVNEASLDVRIVDVDCYAIARAMAFSANGENPLLSMRLAPAKERKVLLDFAPRLLVSCGLALRNMQLW